MANLSRFVEAQADSSAGFEAALRELEGGHKRGHWIWYVFPQLAGLGLSSMSARYALRDVAEARDYLREPLLLSRLLRIVGVVAAELERGASVERLMGSAIDATKLVSSMTLFAAAAATIDDPALVRDCGKLAALAEKVLVSAQKQGYARCKFTLKALAS